MAAPLRIASGALSAEIAPMGAELARLTGADGRDYLWDGDPAWWNGRAPILFPIVGTLNGDRFEYRGVPYALPRHGLARRRAFETIEHGESILRLRLESDEQTRAIWPFDFRLDMRFAIEGARLEMAAEVTNRSDAAMPVSFGFHPALRWPLPGSADKAGHVIHFERDEPERFHRLDKAGLFDPAPRTTPVVGDRLALDEGMFAEDVMIFDRLRSRSLTYSGPGSSPVTVDFAGMPHLGLWMKPGGGFLCIEPWQGHSDPIGFAGSIEEKPGTVTLAPGETRGFAMGIAIG